MTTKDFSPNTNKMVDPVYLSGLTPDTNTYTIKNPELGSIKAIRYRGTDEIKLHFNSDLHGLPTKYFMAQEGCFLVNSTMKSIHFTVDSNKRAKLFLMFE
jgi:hypothetical protein